MNSDTDAEWGGPANLSPWEAVMWRAGADPRTRSASVVYEVLEVEPDWNRLVAAWDRLVGRVPRLRERVLEPPLPLVTPTWSPDPHFDLTYHLHHVHLPTGSSVAEVNNLAATLAAKPFDSHRPPWEGLLVGGLPDGQAAFLLKCHHSLTDGLGMLQLLEMAHSHGREPSGAGSPAKIAKNPAQSGPEMFFNRVVAGLTHAPEQVVRTAAKAVEQVARNPVKATGNAINYGRSLGRMLASPTIERSPLLRDGGIGYRFATFDVPVMLLKAATRAAGGTINDGFLAGLLGGLRRYHERNGIDVDLLPMAIPVSVRSASDPMGGNKFAAARFVAPVGEPDPRKRIATIHEFVTQARDEPALNFVDVIAPVLSVLPTAALTEVSAQMTVANDVQASNMGRVSRSLYFAGAKVLRLYVVGPRPGVALMATMLTYEDSCCIGLNYDPTAIAHDAGFVDCMREGFDEVLALAGPGES